MEFDIYIYRYTYMKFTNVLLIQHVQEVKLHDGGFLFGNQAASRSWNNELRRLFQAN